MKSHKQAEQVLIYIHQDIHNLSEQLKVIAQTLKAIRSRVDSVIATMEIQKTDEPHRE